MEDELTDYNVYEKTLMGKVNVVELLAFFVLTSLILKFTSLNDFFITTTSIGLKETSYVGMFFASICISLIPLSYIIVNGISPVQDALLTVTKFKPIDLSKFLSPRGTKGNAISYMALLCKASSELSKSIFNRGVLYLLLGVFFAIAGLMFFYAQMSLGDLKSDFKTELLHLAPKFGVLFFIELISFYFLRQYRATMDEFRYYEAIQRSREDSLLMLKIITERAKPDEVMGLLEKINFKSSVDKLDNGQSLDILEAKKLDKGELEVLVKAIEALRPKT